MASQLDADSVSRAGLTIRGVLHRFIQDEALPGSGVDADVFWHGLASIVGDLAPQNRDLLENRQLLQSRLDRWHVEHRGAFDLAEYQGFLEEIGYLEPEGPDFRIDPGRIDPEIADIPGPQLVVPVTNARYALNAANARWGSLYDALYGTDATGSAPEPGPYDPVRGATVVAWVRSFLDDVVPLDGGSHADVTAYTVAERSLAAQLADGRQVGLADPSTFAGSLGPDEQPASILLRHNGLHIEVVIDRNHPVGSDDPAGVADVVIESAVTLIMDCEDSVSTVDAADKVGAYRNWLGLMRGDLEDEFEKGGRVVTRALSPDRRFVGPDGSEVVLRGQALMLVRTVGHLMTSAAVLDENGLEIPEGILDSMVTILCALHDLRRPGGPKNSPAGSIYVVKPKMHGPAEVAFTVELFRRIEELLGLEPDTVKVGIMDEERRTSVNLKECIRQAKNRICFVNTGFLDRTGDEIHTSMQAGPMVRKAEMRSQPWLQVYEARNVAICLAAGFTHRAQVGKGMWAAPDQMAKMLDEKIGHLRAGANCAWVPSPTAATLHATHYHRIDIFDVQASLEGRPAPAVGELLGIPLRAGFDDLPGEAIQAELDNNCQGILGYVVRWVEQGIGCSKVPDLDDVNLMEDRATCRISSQHIANWLLHGIVDRDEVDAALRRMAVVVDGQNEGDPNYTPMAPGFEGLAFKAASDLVFAGTEQPSGYTEPILHARRLEWKRQHATG